MRPESAMDCKEVVKDSYKNYSPRTNVEAPFCEVGMHVQKTVYETGSNSCISILYALCQLAGVCIICPGADWTISRPKCR